MSSPKGQGAPRCSEKHTEREDEEVVTTANAKEINVHAATADVLAKKKKSPQTLTDFKQI